MPARLRPQLDHVPPQKDRLRCVLPHSQRLRPLQQPVPLGEIRHHLRRTPALVRVGHPNQPVQPLDPRRQPPDRRVSRAVAVKRQRAHVLLYQRQHLLKNTFLPGQPLEESPGRSHPEDIVPWTPDASLRVRVRRLRLAKVVAEHRQPNHQILPLIPLALSGKSIQAMSRVRPHIPLRMPLRILLATDQRLQFGKVLQPAAVP